jgi:sn-glycerol 3-phosphate transport system ATP-binding protein
MEQVGTPADVYAHPATTFVAGFIGSPPMNLLEGRADGSRLAVGGRELALPAAAPRSGPLIAGVRPEHVEIGADGGWPLEVELIEMLGAERLVHGRIGDAPFTLRFDSTLPAPRMGETVRLHVPPRHLHWFDAVTKQRVEA